MVFLPEEIMVHTFTCYMLIFLSYFERSNNYNSGLARKAIDWIGRNQQYEDEGFSSLDAWNVLFDSRANEINSPEVLNPKLTLIFGW